MTVEEYCNQRRVITKRSFLMPSVPASGKYRCLIRSVKFNDSFGKNVSEIKNRFKDTSELSKLVGIGKSTLNGWIWEQTKLPALDKIKKFGDVFGLTPEELIGDMSISYIDEWRDVWIFTDRHDRTGIEILKVGKLVERFNPLPSDAMSSEGVIKIYEAAIRQAIGIRDGADVIIDRLRKQGFTDYKDRIRLDQAQTEREQSIRFLQWVEYELTGEVQSRKRKKGNDSKKISRTNKTFGSKN